MFMITKGSGARRLFVSLVFNQSSIQYLTIHLIIRHNNYLYLIYWQNAFRLVFSDRARERFYKHKTWSEMS